MMKIFINKFLESVPADIGTIEKHLSEKDWRSVRACAHSMKPQLSYMGIKQLEGVISQIEANAGEEKNLETIPGLVEELKTVCGQSCEELKQIISSLQ